MPVLVFFDFAFAGPFGRELEAMATDLAESITREPGFLWKIWLEDAAAKQAGGAYLFQDRTSAKAYVEKHTARLGQFGVTDPFVRIMDINEGLTKLTKGPV